MNEKFSIKKFAIINAAIGGAFGMLMIFCGLWTTGGGHSYVLIQLFAAPVGTLPPFNVFTLLLLVFVPIWWATMFFVACGSMEKMLSWLLVILGECLHFGMAIYCLTNLPEKEWSYFLYPENLPYFLWLNPYNLVFLAIYAFGHIYIILLLLWKNKLAKLGEAILDKMKNGI